MRDQLSDDSLFGMIGKVAVVTGASSGIGLMIAGGLVARGVRTYIVGRNVDRLNIACETLSASGVCIAAAADITTPEGRDSILEAVTHEGRLDVLVNNAGATDAAPIESTDPARFERILRINIAAPFALIGTLAPLLRAAASAEMPARIINIASIDAIRTPIWESYAYGASKAGIAHMTRHLAKTLALENITVNAIAPGFFPSQMTRFMFDDKHPHYQPLPTIPLGRAGVAEDLVGAVVYLASRAGSYVTGTLLPVAGGLATAE
jgi:NAD(P)-dependent dehydrogenase (short-subunit alcohol dehydrogenase family)